MNPNFKDQSIRSLGVLTHGVPSGEVRVLQGGGYIMPPLANSRFVANHTIERPLTTVGIPSQSRFVTPEVRQLTRNFQTKHSSHSISDYPSADRPSVDRPSGVEFDYQKQYEKLLVKYRKKEEKNRRHLKDLSNQIIVKDSIINNFQQEIASYRAPDSQRLQQQLDQLRRTCDEQQRELSTFRLKVLAAEQELKKRENDYTVAAAVTGRESAKDLELLQLRRRIEELENRLQQAGTTTDKANKDRDYFLARVADSEKQIRLKDEKLAEVENTLSRSTQQLHDLRQENQLLNARFVDKTEQSRSLYDKMLQQQNSKIREYESEISRRLSQLSDMQRQLESAPQQLAVKLEQQRQESEKKLQAKDLKLFETDSQRLKLSRQLSDLTKQLEITGQQFQTKHEQQEKILQMQSERIENLERDIANVSKQNYELRNNSRLELSKVTQDKDSKLNELEGELARDQQLIGQLKKQLDSLTRQNKLNEDHYKQSAERAQQNSQLRVEALERQLEGRSKQLTDLKAHYDGVIIQQAGRADEMKQDLLLQLQNKREALQEAERSIEEAKKAAAQNSGQLAYKLQELEKTTKLKDSRLEQLQPELANLKRMLQTERDQYQNQSKTTLIRTNELNQELLRRERRIGQLENQQKSYLARLDEARATVENTNREQSARFEESQRTHRLHIDMKEKRISELQQRQLELTEELRQSKINQLQSSDQTTELQRQINTLSKELETRKLHVDAISKKYSNDQSDKDALLNQKTAEIRELNSEISSMKPQLTRSQEEARSYKQENELVKKLLRDKDAQISSYALKSSGMAEEIRQKALKVEELAGQVSALDAQLARINKKLTGDKQESDGRVNSLASQLLRLQNEIQALNIQHSEEVRSIQNELAARTSASSKFESELTYLKHTENSLRKTIQSKQQQISRQNSTIQVLRQEHINRQEESERKNVEQLMAIQQDKERQQTELSSLRLERQNLQNVLAEKQRDLSTQQARVVHLTNENDVFRKEIVSLNKKLSETVKNYDSKITEGDREKSGKDEQLRNLRLQLASQETAIALKDRELKAKTSYISTLDERLKTREQSNSQLSQDLVVQVSKYEESSRDAAAVKYELTTIKRLLEQKEQQRGVLAEALMREKKQNDQLMTNNQSTAAGHDTLVKQLQEVKKDLNQQLETVARLRTDLDQSRSSQLRESQQRAELEAQLDPLRAQLLAKEDKISAQQASIDAMEMIIDKMHKVQDGQSEKQAVSDQASNALTERISILEQKIKELDQMKCQLTEQLVQANSFNSALMQEKSEIERETNDAVRSIQTQMQQLQEVSHKVLEKQDCDRLEYNQRLQEKEQYIGQLVDTIEQLHRSSRSQQTSPMKEQKMEDQGQFVKLSDFESAIREKDKEIDKYKKLLDLQKRSEERSRSQTPRKMSGDEEQLQATLGEPPVAPINEPLVVAIAIDYQHKYKALLISLELQEDESEESVINRVETLLTTNNRYEKSVQDLMQKIDWMEQNLNLLNQENNEFHLELENKDNAAAELSKIIAVRDKTIAELRNYEAHLTKKMLKTEELLELGNRTIINLQLRLLSDKHEFVDREEVLMLELQSLQQRIRMFGSQVKSQEETGEESQQIEEGDESVLRSGSFRRLDEQQLLANISFLSGLVKLRDNSHLERLYRSQEFMSLRQYFTQLARQELSQVLTLSQSLE